MRLTHNFKSRIILARFYASSTMGRIVQKSKEAFIGHTWLGLKGQGPGKSCLQGLGAPSPCCPCPTK